MMGMDPTEISGTVREGTADQPKSSAVDGGGGDVCMCHHRAPKGTVVKPVFHGSTRVGRDHSRTSTGSGRQYV